MQGVQVQLLVGELRFHILRDKKPKHKQQKQYRNRFNKGFLKEKMFQAGLGGFTGPMEQGKHHLRIQSM